MQLWPEVIYDLSDLRYGVIVGGDEGEGRVCSPRFINSLWDECGLSLIKCNRFQQFVGDRGVIAPVPENLLVFSNALVKVLFIRVGSQVPQGFPNDDAFPRPSRMVGSGMYVQLLVGSFNVRLNIQYPTLSEPLTLVHCRVQECDLVWAAL